jgi:23S rRNA (guanosine2251-2'-O)-methyltransferase
MPKPSPRRPGAPAHRPNPAPETAPRQPGETWLWGRHAVLAALANPERKLLRLVATAEAAADLARMPELAEALRPRIVEREALQALLPANAVHQGVALLAKPLRPVAVEDVIDGLRGGEAVAVVLDQVSDPHNVGAVMRSAAAFGAAAVIVPERHAPEISGVLAKAASGAVEHVPLVRVVNLARALAQLKEAGWWIVGLDGAAERTLAQHNLSGKVALVLGAEGDGMRRLTRAACDLMARLPTAGPVASLNVSNAAAAALYELARERA